MEKLIPARGKRSLREIFFTSFFFSNRGSKYFGVFLLHARILGELIYLFGVFGSCIFRLARDIFLLDLNLAPGIRAIDKGRGEGKNEDEIFLGTLALVSDSFFRGQNFCTFSEDAEKSVTNRRRQDE